MSTQPPTICRDLKTTMLRELPTPYRLVYVVRCPNLVRHLTAPIPLSVFPLVRGLLVLSDWGYATQTIIPQYVDTDVSMISGITSEHLAPKIVVVHDRKKFNTSQQES